MSTNNLTTTAATANSPMHPYPLSQNERDDLTIVKEHEMSYCSNGRFVVSVDLAVSLSWAVNWFLLIAKIYTAIISNSKAVWASLADSFVDLLSQAVLSLATRYIKKHDPDYPVGRSRLEALSVLASAGIMTMASIEVIQFSCMDLANGMEGNIPVIDASLSMYVILSLGIFFKVILYIYCRFAFMVVESDSLEALAEDHLNDVMSNTAALVTASIAFHSHGGWWVDPAGAILISLAIIYRWIFLMRSSLKSYNTSKYPKFILNKYK